MLSALEHIVLSGAFHGRLSTMWQAPRRIGRALMSLPDWRAFLIGPIRLFQRTASRSVGPWLGDGN